MAVHLEKHLFDVLKSMSRHYHLYYDSFDHNKRVVVQVAKGSIESTKEKLHTFLDGYNKQQKTKWVLKEEPYYKQ